MQPRNNTPALFAISARRTSETDMTPRFPECHSHQHALQAAALEEMALTFNAAFEQEKEAIQARSARGRPRLFRVVKIA